MTLKYKLLGKPGNVEEFLDKLKKKDEKQVKLYSEVGYHTFKRFPGAVSFFLVFESPILKILKVNEIFLFLCIKIHKIFKFHAPKYIYGEGGNNRSSL